MSSIGSPEGPPLTTPRLVIRRPRDEDAPRLDALLRDRAVAPMLIPGDPWGAPGTRRLRLLAVDPFSDELLGMVAFRDQWLSYCIEPVAWGRGFGTEMVGAALEEIVPSLGLREVEAVVARGNARSRRLLERLGFRFSGLGRIACRRSTATIPALNYRKHVASIAAHCSREERHV